MNRSTTIHVRLKPTRSHLGAVGASAGALLLALFGVFGGFSAAQVVAQTVPPRIPVATLPVLRNTTTGTFGVYTVNGNNATLVQTSPTGIANWSSFDIGSAAKLQIIQPSSTSTLLNRIEGGLLGNGRTTIDGSLTSNGQLYMINPNGIVFGHTSRVDVGSLIASSLAMDENRYKAGLLIPNLNPILGGQLIAGVRPGDVVVEGSMVGGVLQQAALTASKNGYLLLAAPNVTNNGKLSAPDGQVALAAGSRVYLAAPLDASMRGLRVEVGDEELRKLAEMKPAEFVKPTATNGVLGDIQVDRGNVTMAGLMVNQLGKVSATTSVNQNGSIFLRARTATKASSSEDPKPNVGGSLVLGEGSETSVKPTLADKTTSLVGAPFIRSSVDLAGEQVTLKENAAVIAPNGVVTITARQQDGDLIPNRAPNTGESAYQVRFGAGSRVDVSGTNVDLPMESHVVSVELRGTELADNLLLRDSVLRGKTVQVDGRKGTAIANINGWLDLRESGVGEKTASGGQISVFADGAIKQEGGRLDVSGGSVRFAAGHVPTTRLRSGSALVDIGSAKLGRVYDGLISAQAGPENFEPSYVDGRDAGSLSLSAPKLTLNGSLAGAVTIGERQRLVQSVLDFERLGLVQQRRSIRPQGAELNIGADAAGAALSAEKPRATAAGVDQDLVFATAPPTQNPLGEDNPTRDILHLDLNALGRAGFSRFSTKTLGNASIADAIALAPGGSLRIEASGLNPQGTEARERDPKGTGPGNVSVNADVNIPSGTLTVKALREVSVAPAVEINVAGLWTNDQATTQPLRDANGALVGDVVLRGGKIDLSANQLWVGDSSRFDVSAGRWLNEAGALSAAKDSVPGSISLRATVLRFGGSSDGSADDGPAEVKNTLKLGTGVAFLGYGFDRGGALNLTGRNVYLGFPGGQAYDSRYPDLVLDPAFFARGGFGRFAIEANANLIVSAGTSIAPQAQAWVLNPNAAWTRSGLMSRAAQARQLDLIDPLGNRPMASVELAAKAVQSEPAEIAKDNTAESNGTSLPFGTLRVEVDARIVVDPGASINLSAGRRLTVNGTLEAPGGAVSLTLTQAAPSQSAADYDPERAIRLGPKAQLLAVGTDARLGVYPNASITGALLDGGRVQIGQSSGGGTLLPAVGYVEASPGSLIDVSGWSPTNAADKAIPEKEVGSSAGSIEIRAREGLSLAGQLVGGAGGRSRSGGSLTLELDRKGSSGPGYPTADSDLVISSSSSGRGFDRLNFRSDRTISLDRGVNLSAGASIVLDAPVLRAAPAGGSAATSASAVSPTNTITAPFVQLGNGDELTQTVERAPFPAGGANANDPTLTVRAKTLDLVGRSRIDGYAVTRLEAEEEIRMTGRVVSTPRTDALENELTATEKVVGALDTKRSLVLRAPKIYPTTLTEFALNVADVVATDGLTLRGTLTIEAPEGVIDQTPIFSAGGSLSARAWSIDQGGRLSAPFGSIELIAGSQLRLRAGSLTSVAGDGQVLLGSVVNGQDWSYDFGTSGLRFSNAPNDTAFVYERRLPAKAIRLEAPRLAINLGAQVSLAGGGQLSSSEFVPGPSGLTDPLSKSGVYAILPSYRASVASADWDLATAKTVLDPRSGSLRVGDVVWLSGFGDLAAGYYTLLPARYALLPGAYSIAQSGSLGSTVRGLPAAVNRVNLDGSLTVAGYRAGMERLLDGKTDGKMNGARSIDSQWSDFKLTSRDLVLKSAEFRLYDASTFFATLPQPELPTDAGHLTLSAENELSLNGQFRLMGASSGRGGLVDIVSPGGLRVASTLPKQPAAGVIDLLADQITAMKAASVLIGGERTEKDGSTLMDVRSRSVTIANDPKHPIEAPELLIAGRDVVQIDESAVLRSIADPSLGATRVPVSIQIAGTGALVDGALVRLTSQADAEVVRQQPAGLTGKLTIAQGATLAAGSSLLLEATADLKLRGDLNPPDGSSLLVSAPRISVGQTVPGGVDGVVFEGGALARLGRLASVDLRSYSTIDFYGSGVLGGDALSQLSLRASAFERRDGVGENSNVRLSAGVIRLSGVGAATFDQGVPAGVFQTGSRFDLVARDAVEFANGALAIRGFDATKIEANQGFGAKGSSGSLSTSGSLAIAAPLFSAGRGSSLSVIAAGKLELTTLTVAPVNSTPKTPDLGGQLIFEAGGELLSSANITLPSGRLSLSGRTVNLTGGGLSVAGVPVTFGSTRIGSPGGTLTLASKGGDLIVAANATLDVGAVEADGGDLVLSAPMGELRVDGQLKGAAELSSGGNPVAQSRVMIDVGQVGDAGLLGRLAERMGAAGFTDGFDLRARSGNLNLGQNEKIRARKVTIAADNGNLRIDGDIDASGARAGEIGLYASERTLGNGRIELGATARLVAGVASTASDAGSSNANPTPVIDGGRIFLGVGREDGTMPVAIDGGSSILIQPGATLSAAGIGQGQSGSLVLRAPRVGTTSATARDVAVTMRGAVISGIAETVIEANQVYLLENGATLSARSDSKKNLDVRSGGKMATDVENFKQFGAQVLDRLGSDKSIVLRPGVEVRSAGSLTVSVNEDEPEAVDRGWNLNTWRMAGQPGTLTLRAAGDLTLKGSISDGYVKPSTNLAMPAWQLDPAAGASWGYRLVAGADFKAAQPTTVSPARGADLRVGFVRSVAVDEGDEPLASFDLPVALIRSGTGRIELSASRDVVLESLVQKSRTDGASDVRLGATVYTGGRAVAAPPGSSLPTYQTDTAWGEKTTALAPIGRNGGSIEIVAGRDVLGSPQPRLSTNALVRQDGPGLNTAWWMNADQMRDGVATLGGGDLSIVAKAGSIRDFSASVATSAFSTRDAQGRLTLSEFGGGRLQLSAAKDIAGGTFYVQRGVGEIRAGGSLTLGNPSVFDSFIGAYRARSPVLALGTARWDVLAGDELRLEAIYNPTITPDGNWKLEDSNAFLTYGSDSAVRLRALGGGITLTNDDRLLEQAINGKPLANRVGIDPKRLFRLMPGRLTAAALGGDLEVLRGFAMAPGAATQLNLLARGSVNLRNLDSEKSGVVQIDADPAQFPSFSATRALNESDYKLLKGETQGLLGHNSTNLQAGSKEPMRVIALEGDISGDFVPAATLDLIRRAEIIAGRDIRDLGFRIQQNNPADVTEIRATRDFVDSTISNLQAPTNVAHVITGPGRVAISAGRNVDLGNSVGLVSRGNLDNPYLPEGGVSLQVVSGVAAASSGSVALDASDPSAARDWLVKKDPKKYVELTKEWPQLNEAFFNQLVAAAKEAKEKGLSDFDGLIATLFPTTSAKGNIDLTGSQVKTEQGGSVDLFAPAGSINVSLVRIPDFIAVKKPSELGVITVRGGAVRALVRDDFLVNTGRVFTLRGGDITLVSQYGNIDAGRGAKTATSAPPPLLTTDQYGNTKLDISGSIAGSGIATLQTQENQAPSNVYPVAPRGIFDAGDAGVRSTGTVQITAQAVLNAGNISAAGGVTGAPPVAAPALGGLALPTSTTPNPEGVGKSAAPEQRLLALDVEVLCFGEGDEAVEAGGPKPRSDEGCKRKKKDPAQVSELAPIINSQSKL
jgi:filamentous hemagglutinin family protein